MTYQAVREIEVRGRATIFGDVHGKISALERILAARDVERDFDRGGHDLIFVGDLVDRGPREERAGRMVCTGVEAVMDRILALRRRRPDRVHCVAGNHELMHVRDIEKRKLADGAFSQWGGQGTLTLTAERLEFLRGLPLVLLVRGLAERAVVVHGGPPSVAGALATLLDAPDLLTAHDRGRAGRELLWSNPAWSRGSHHIEYAYTRDDVAAFLDAHGADYLFRGHRDEPESLVMPGARRYICVHTAQGERHTDDAASGSTHIEWDPPAGPRLVRL